MKRIYFLLLTLSSAALLSACEMTAPTTDVQTNTQELTAQWVEIPRDSAEPLYERYVDTGRRMSSNENPHWVQSYILGQHDDENTNAEKSDHAYVFSITIDCLNNAIKLDEMFVYAQRDAQGNVLGIHPMSGEFAPISENSIQPIRQALCLEGSPRAAPFNVARVR